MAQHTRTEITGLLRLLRTPEQGGQEARERIYNALYDELRAIARRLLARESNRRSLQPTELVHEAFLKLVDDSKVDWHDRAHFLAVAARAMRQVLVEQARRKGATKRGADWRHVTFEEGTAWTPEQASAILELEEVMGRLAALSDRAAQVAEMRIFGGMTHDEIAAALGVSERTVAGDWAIGRKWLARELNVHDP